MFKKKLYSIDEAKKLTIDDVQKLYNDYINPNQTKIFSSLPFGNELFEEAEGVFMFTSSGKKILDFISTIFIIFFSVFVVYYGWLIAYDSLEVGRTSSTILDLPSFLTELAIPLCFGFLLIRVLIEFIKFILDFFKK